MKIGERLKELRNKLSFDSKEFSEKLNISYQNYKNYENNYRGISDETKIKLINDFNVNINWLLTGEGSMFREEKIPETFQDAKIYLQKDQRIIAADNLFDGSIIFVYGGTNKVSAGIGQEVLNNIPEKAIPVLEKFLSPFQGKEAGWTEVVGDSMVNEKLFDGDLVIYIKGLIRGEGIYVIQYATETMVKRLEFDSFDKKIYIKSANEKYAYRDKCVNMDDENLCILGKVKFWMHNHPY